MDSQLKILIQATLAATTETDINTEIGKLKINTLQIPISVSTQEIKRILSELNVTINNSNKNQPKIKVLDTGDLDSQKIKYFEGVDDIENRVKAFYSKMGKTDVTLFKDAQKDITGFTASVTKSDGIVEKFKFKLASIGNALGEQKGFVYDGASITDKLIGTDLDKKIGMLDRLDNRLKDIRQKSFDLSKPLTEVDHVETLNKKYAAIDAEINKVRLSGDAMSKAQQRNIGNLIADAERYRKEMQRQEYPGTKLDPTSLSNNKSKYEADLLTSEKRWKSQGVLVDSFKIKVEALKAELASVGSTDDLHKFEHNLDLTNAEAKQLLLTLRQFNAETAQNTARNKLENYLKINPKAYASSTLAFQKLEDSIKGITNTTANSNWGKSFTEVTGTVEKLGRAGETVFGGLLKNMSKFSAWIISSGAVMSLITTFKKVLDNVINIDTQMVALKKVTDETSETYDKFLDNAANKAQKLGTTISDLIKSTGDFARLGYGIDDASKLAEVANIYRNVGDIDISSATESIISTIRAFNIEASQSIEIVDKFNEVSISAPLRLVA